MDNESAIAAAEKARLYSLNVKIHLTRHFPQADAIRVKVGFPLSPNTESAESIARYYGLVKINETRFFENIISARQVYVFHWR